MTNIQKYKEMEIRVTLMKNSDWVKTISDLRNFKYEDKKEYIVTYKQTTQRKNRTMYFDDVKYDEETYIFTFTRYVRDQMTEEKTNEKLDEKLIKDIEVISLRIEDEYDFSSYIY